MVEKAKGPTLDELLDAALRSYGKQPPVRINSSVVVPPFRPVPPLPWEPAKPSVIAETTQTPDRNLLARLYDTRVFGLPVVKFFEGIAWGAGGTIVSSTPSSVAEVAVPIALASAGALGLTHAIREYQTQKNPNAWELKKGFRRRRRADKKRLALAASAGAVMALAGAIITNQVTDRLIVSAPAEVSTYTEQPIPTQVPTPAPTFTPGLPSFIEERGGKRYLVVPTETASNSEEK